MRGICDSEIMAYLVFNVESGSHLEWPRYAQTRITNAFIDMISRTHAQLVYGAHEMIGNMAKFSIQK